MKNISKFLIVFSFLFVSTMSLAMQQDYRQLLSLYERLGDDQDNNEMIDNAVLEQVQCILAKAQQQLASVSPYFQKQGMANEYAKRVRSEFLSMHAQYTTIPHTSTAFDMSEMRMSLQRACEYAERAHFWAYRQR